MERRDCNLPAPHLVSPYLSDPSMRAWDFTACSGIRRFAVLNDFEAIGYGVPVVPPADLLVLHDAPLQPKVNL